MLSLALRGLQQLETRCFNWISGSTIENGMTQSRLARFTTPGDPIGVSAGFTFGLFGK
jgi:hypothetical protein